MTKADLDIFLNQCEIKMDVYDPSKKIAYLYDPGLGGEVSKIDYLDENETIVGEAFDWQDRLYYVDEKMGEIIYRFLYEGSQDECRQWDENKDDNYDVREEQGLFGYGY